MSIVCELKLNNQSEIFEFNKVAKLSNGSVLLKMQDAVLLATVACEYNNPVSDDFIPLTVQYVEKAYALAKIPGGFIKREHKPSDFETLTSRIIDRSLRPLFPKGFIYPTTITVMVLSCDTKLDPQVLALKAASAALYTSDLPIKKSISGVKIGKIDNKLIINPTIEEQGLSTLDLYVAGSSTELFMIEMKSISTNTIVEDSVDSFTNIHEINDIAEDKLIEAIKLAKDTLVNYNTTYEKSFETAVKTTIDATLVEYEADKELINYIRTNYSTQIKIAVQVYSKQNRVKALDDVVILITKDKAMIDDNIILKDIYNCVSIIKKEIIRSMAIEDGARADGRSLKEVRPIDIEINILPSAHSSCLFTRGETQVLSVGTLGSAKDGQMYEVLSSKTPLIENFMVHYNFPGFSVGEAKPMFGANRRELGHGNLAKRALESSIDKDYTDTIRIVAEVLESNGSSSMATVCSGSLVLKAAGVPTHSLVAGIAMGAIIENNKYAILTDIIGLEDYDGDMDFKVAGTKNGITALQMDIKLNGISLKFLQEVLEQAKDGRNHILSIMENSASNIIPSSALPLIEQFKIDPSKVFSVIGKAGSVIRDIIERFEVKIDLNKDNGHVKVTGSHIDNIKNAANHIKSISSNTKNSPKKEIINFEELYDIDSVYEGKVLRIVDFGAFIQLPKGGDGLLHISKISKDSVKNVRDILEEEQTMRVKILKLSCDRIELTAIDVE
ncbi:Polyribonucleotide nucleotidyltransferase [hydrothermal vent metagenome]|uniref:polyribonucleotide nucleotidyltransferase n=1 Tax=hydrothermal vent metagenome TaxID=652676 RepID=A0A3B1E5V4_9ZZZZ